MVFGLDYSGGTNPNTPKVMGAKFVARYVGYFTGYDINNIGKQQGKCLTPSEATELMDKGVGIVSIYEWYTDRPSLSNNGGSATLAYVAGTSDAHTAATIHAACGGPNNAPIYFSVDYNSNGTDVVDYFLGVASYLGIERTGVYGGYACVKYLLDQKLVRWAMQTYAWSGNLLDDRANIYQYSNGMKLADGTQGDYNDSKKPSYGNWLDYKGGIQLEFSNELCCQVWASKYPPNNDPNTRVNGIFDMWRSAWIAGDFWGAPDGPEFNIKTQFGPGKGRNFGSKMAWWFNNATKGLLTSTK